jgi:hypothetical protein
MNNNLIRCTMHVMYCIRIVVHGNAVKTIPASNQKPRVYDSIAQRSFLDDYPKPSVLSSGTFGHVNTSSVVRKFAGALENLSLQASLFEARTDFQTKHLSDLTRKLIIE